MPIIDHPPTVHCTAPWQDAQSHVGACRRVTAHTTHHHPLSAPTIGRRTMQPVILPLSPHTQHQRTQGGIGLPSGSCRYWHIYRIGVVEEPSERNFPYLYICRQRFHSRSSAVRTREGVLRKSCPLLQVYLVCLSVRAMLYRIPVGAGVVHRY